MSFENHRLERIQRIIELLQANPQGLKPEVIAKETKILREVTKQRFFLYLQELQWSGEVVILRDGGLS